MKEQQLFCTDAHSQWLVSHLHGFRLLPMCCTLWFPTDLDSYFLCAVHMATCLLALSALLALPVSWYWHINWSTYCQINIPSTHSPPFLQSIFLTCHRQSDMYQNHHAELLIFSFFFMYPALSPFIHSTQSHPTAALGVVCLNISGISWMLFIQTA